MYTLLAHMHQLCNVQIYWSVVEETLHKDADKSFVVENITEPTQAKEEPQPELEAPQVGRPTSLHAYAIIKM